MAAAGAGMTAMLALVGAMGLAQRTTPTTPAPAPAPPVAEPTAQVVVVVGRASAPIPLTAQPTVREAPASQQPVAQTNGSR